MHTGGLKPPSFHFCSQNAHVFAAEKVVGVGFEQRVRFK